MDSPPTPPPDPNPKRRDLLGATIDGEGQWSTATRDRAVGVAFVVTGVVLVLLIWPFLDALLFASATVVVTWPLYQRVLARTGGRTRLASALTTVGIGLLLLAPLSVLGVWFVQETVAFVNQFVEMATDGELQARARELLARFEPVLREVTARTGIKLDPAALVPPLQRGLVAAGQGLARTLPEWLGSVLVAALDAFVFLFAVLTLYSEGPRLAAAARRISPMRAAHTERLFEVFREFSTNMAIGAVGTAVLQGAVASVGYTIAGVPNLVLVTLLTVVFGFVPFVGTAMVWVPATVWTTANHGWGWGLFLFAWSAGLTGSIDNLVRPFLLRGRSAIHPLPIFLSVLGGIAWMGLPGALVGPVCVAVFLALYQIWTEPGARTG